MIFRERLRTLKAQAEQGRAERPWLYDPNLLERWTDHCRTQTAGLEVGYDPIDEDAEPVEPVKRRNRKLTLAGITKQAAKAGLTVVRVDFDQDGKVAGIVTGKQPIEDDATPEQRSRWH